MSNQNDSTENLEEEVVVEETTKRSLVPEKIKEIKDAPKTKKVLKTAGKVLGVGLVGLIGYMIGSKSSRKDSNNSEEVIDVEYDIDNSNE